MLWSDDLPRTIVPRVYTRVSISISLCVCAPLPSDPWDGSGWKRGRSRRTTSEGREGRVCPCAARTRMGGRVSRAVSRPPRSAGRDGTARHGMAGERAGGQQLRASCPLQQRCVLVLPEAQNLLRWEVCACGGPALFVGWGPPACPDTPLFFHVTLADSCEVQGRVFPSGNERAPTQCHCMGAPVWEVGPLLSLCSPSVVLLFCWPATLGFLGPTFCVLNCCCSVYLEGL